MTQPLALAALLETVRLKNAVADTLLDDLRSPLSVIETALSLLSVPGASAAPRTEELVAVAQDAVESALVTVAEIAAMCQSDGSARSLMVVDDLAAVLESCAMTATKFGHTIGIDLDASIAGPLVAPHDPQGLARALSRLLACAQKVTPLGGCVRLEGCRVGAGAGTRIQIEIRAGDGGGVGGGGRISSEELPYLFDRLRDREPGRATTRGAATFALVRHIVDAHRGEVRARRGDQGETIFTISLPCGER